MIAYINDLIARYPALQPCLPDIYHAYELLATSFKTGGKLLLCGNGGSASDSDHWAGELLKGFAHPRPLSTSLRQGWPENLANKLQWAFPAIPLSGFLTKTVYILISAILISASVQAGSSAPAVTPKATALTAAAARDAKREELKRMIRVNLEALRPSLPSLKESDLFGCCPEKLRDLYYQSYRAQGLKMD